ncbi:hypothetical protein BLS_005010 [Venturia inaequalis]|uniref:Sphingolipid long chain base-responsive protein LSP1 n=1 Tax=Venturia inaequalis TaxID=5025 RepID=A0A8H3UIY6_VENIN|nr:hypothetical protein BLS_005010 [Venturia inaequalis]
MSSLRSAVPGQPELSKKMNKMIKSENHAISAYDTAGRERVGLAQQLSEWGESTGDDAVSEISDKMGVLLAEIGEQEDVFAQGLEEYRSVLKQIRNTETSVQPSRDHKAKITDELAKLKYKEPSSTKIVTLEQELVRAEAQSLVAEAQLTNITRQKFREAYTVQLAAILERSEKQALLAKQAQRLILLLDDSPIVPGQERPAFTRHEKVRDVINEAEAELRSWTPSWQQHEAGSSTSVGDSGLATESGVIARATGQGHTSDGTHLAEVTSAPPPTQTHADLHHDPSAHANSTANTSVALPGEAGSVAGSEMPQIVEQPHAA